MSTAVIIGQHRGAARSPAAQERLRRHVATNFYPTPPEATRALLSVESFDGSIQESACGQGHISRVLEAAGHQVISTDLNDWGFGETGQDFLAQPMPRAKHIVTNPPYGRGLADAFIRKALTLTRETGGKVAMLLNLASLAHELRTPRWRKTPPARLYAIDSVLCWPDPEFPPPAHFAENRYCWAVWELGHTGPAAFWWLSAAEFR